MYDGDPDWFVKDGDYPFVAGSIQECIRVLSARDKAISTKPIGGSSAPPRAITQG